MCHREARKFEEFDDVATEPGIRRPLSLTLPTEDSVWRCQICGFEHRGPCPPKVCPDCGVGPERWDQLQARARPKLDTDPTGWLSHGSCSTCGSPIEVSARCKVCWGRQAWLGPWPNKAGSSMPPKHHASPRTYVVLGTGIAAVRSAEVVRANDNAARIVMISRERCLPYHRINLTRYLNADVDAASMMLHAPGWYAEQGIDVRLETDAMELRRGEHTVRTRSQVIEYDRLVIATGARVRVPSVANVWLDGVCALRSFEDTSRILATASVGRRVVVVGGGLLGVEAAVALRRRGCEVAICERGERMMHRQL
ncbi:MAG: hypothetical protein CSA75_02680, partial [Sorangium cellulosum]